jgi:hypothetical protein
VPGKSGVLFFLAAFPATSRTGGEMYFRILIDGLAAQGVAVTVVAPDQELPGMSIHDPHNRAAITQAIRTLLDKHASTVRVLLPDSWLYRCFWSISLRERLRGRYCFIGFSQLC